MISIEQLQLKIKSQQILCQTHKQSITQLSIGKNIKLGERLICEECDTLDQQLLYFNQVEKYLYKMYEEQYQTYINEQQKVETAFNSFEIEIEKIQKQITLIINKFQENILELIKTFNQLILTNKQKFSQLLKQQQKTQLSQLIEKIANSNVLDYQILQETAEFISNQIIVDGKLELKNKVQIPDSTKKQISESNERISAYLNQIKAVLNQKIDQKQQKQTKILLIEQQQQENLLDYETFKYNDPIQLEGHNNFIGAVAMSNNELLMASGDHDGQIILWDFNSRSIKQKYNIEKWILDLIFSFDDKLLAAAQCFSPNDILIFNLSLISSTSPQIRLKGHFDSVMRIVFTSNSQFLISGSWDFTLRIWKLDGSREVCNKKLSSWVNGVNISPNQQYISACCLNGQAYLFNSSDIQNTKELINWKANDDYACGTTFTPDSKMVLICDKGDIKLWNIDQLLSNDQAKKTPLKVFKTEQNSYFWSLSIRMNGSILISNDNQIRIWNMESGKLIQTLSVPGGYQYVNDKNFSVSKDMKYIITGGNNRKLKVYELQMKLQ